MLKISSKFKLINIQETLNLANLLSLTNYSEVSNIESKNKLKLELFNQLKIDYRSKNFSKIKFIYLDTSFKFGNSIILLNNLLYYCEILEINNIYLNSYMNWPLKNDIILNKINITFISPLDVDLSDEKIILFNPFSVYFQKVIRPEIRINKLRDEILKNMPKIYIDPDDLYIHIRGGDIFKCKSCNDIDYSQPPFCFYQKILNKFKFRNIYIISEDKMNPVISPLLNKFPKIILSQNLIQTDIAILSNAYNIVGSMSSFLISLVNININLKNYWEYDNYRLTEKFWHLHPKIYLNKIKFKIFTMNSSFNYKNKMFPWKNKKEQIKLMLSEKCNDF